MVIRWCAAGDCVSAVMGLSLIFPVLPRFLVCREWDATNAFVPVGEPQPAKGDQGAGAAEEEDEVCGQQQHGAHQDVERAVAVPVYRFHFHAHVRRKTLSGRAEPRTHIYITARTGR